MRGAILAKVLRVVYGAIFSAVAMGQTLSEQNECLFETIEAVHNPTAEQMKKLREIFSKAGFIGQGNPAVTEHPVSVAACEEKLKREKIIYESTEFENICDSKYMAPLYDPQTQKPAEATACIDQFEFPGIPCAYPVVWVRAKEAGQICEAMGKRLCDAHEWEGACAGSLQPPDYPFERAKGVSPAEGFRRMRAAHNQQHDSQKAWGYGKSFQKGICAQASKKSANCNGGSWKDCGSNTYPAGFFPDCHSELEVYDIHGNAAEHMNLPLSAQQMASRGSKTLGQTEMKGSWFIWDHFQAHPDHCRWRAPYWHGSAVMDDHSHHNYHLGFRCCKTVAP